MSLIDDRDAREREFVASLHGADITKQNTHRPGHSSSKTVVGLDLFYRQWFPTQVGAD